LDFVTEIVARQGLEDLIKAFAREDYRAAARRSLQIVEHRLKFLEIADFDEPGARGTSHGKAKDRDELSL
jgi:hypothetical protein